MWYTKKYCAVPCCCISLTTKLVISAVFLFFETGNTGVGGLFFGATSDLYCLLAVTFTFVRGPRFPICNTFLVVNNTLNLYNSVTLSLGYVCRRSTGRCLGTKFLFFLVKRVFCGTTIV